MDALKPESMVRATASGANDCCVYFTIAASSPRTASTIIEQNDLASRHTLNV
jgi:hypothetical protein